MLSNSIAVRVSRFSKRFLSTGINAHGWGISNSCELGIPLPSGFSLPSQSKLAIWSNPVDGFTVFKPRLIDEISGRYKSIVCGKTISFGITNNGNVEAWGDGRNFRFGDSKEQICHNPVEVKFPENVVITQISASATHVAAVDSDGKLWTWGKITEKQHKGVLGSDAMELKQPTLYSLLYEKGIKVIKAACGDSHTSILTDQGEVFCFGNGEFGRLGQGSSSSSSLALVVDALEKFHITQLFAGDSSTLCLTDEGRVFGWGKNEVGQLGLASGVGDMYSSKSYPTEIELDAFDGHPIKVIGAGADHAAAIDAEGNGFFWGYNLHLTPFKLKCRENLVDVKCGSKYTIFKSEFGQLYSIGQWKSGCLGREGRENNKQLTLIDEFKNIIVKE